MCWEIVQYCEAGKKHEPSACQDNCFKIADPQCDVMVLCDGTSDAEYSEYGSKWVAEFSARFFCKHFDDLYHVSFEKKCKVLTDYHQQLLLYIVECASKELGIEIYDKEKLSKKGKRIISSEKLTKFSTTIQAVALRDGKGILYKVGNGSAIRLGKNGAVILSDSPTESPTKQIVLPNTLSVLNICEFKEFDLDRGDYAVVLMTDGVEYSGGLFYNHKIEAGFFELQNLIQKNDLSEPILRNYIDQIKKSSSNITGDDIGISVLYNAAILEDDLFEDGSNSCLDDEGYRTTANSEDLDEKTDSGDDCLDTKPKEEVCTGEVNDNVADLDDSNLPNICDNKKNVEKERTVKKVINKRSRRRLAETFFIVLLVGWLLMGFFLGSKIEMLSTNVGRLAGELALMNAQIKQEKDSSQAKSDTEETKDEDKAENEDVLNNESN